MAMLSPATLVAPGVYRLRIPLPFALEHVNCYLLPGHEGWTIVDTGLNTADGRATWRAAFEQLAVRPADIRQIVITHSHPDHIGLAGWLQGWATGAGSAPPVRMSAGAWRTTQLYWADFERRAPIMKRYFRACGLTADDADALTASTARTRAATLPLPADNALLARDGLLHAGGRVFRLIAAPGHADGQLLLYDMADRLLLCADHVLPKITPNIARWPDGDPDPLASFLDSLAALAFLDVRLALPGHRDPITAWSARVGELRVHHANRLAWTLAAVRDRPGATVLELSRVIFDWGVFTVHEMRFAVAETLAHLCYLVGTGDVTVSADDVWRYNVNEPSPSPTSARRPEWE